VSLILHLSDLHLGSPRPWQFDYDDKVGAGPGAGNTDTSHLRRSLRALGKELVHTDRPLDAVVVTGDLTKGNTPEGYAEFAGLLKELGEALPPPERICVIPGNHDVDRDLAPGDPAKLGQFMDAVRPTYGSPLVKGVDYDDESLDLDTGARGESRPILELEDALILCINSADYCGTQEDRTKTDWDEVLAAYRAEEKTVQAKEARDRAAAELGQLRNYDLALVAFRQIEALGELLDDAGVPADPDADKRLRIAAIHHPIGVAATRLEIKPFETIANIGEVRSFLRDRGFHLILHGHKHESHAAWDWLVPAGEELDTVPRRALVLGAPGHFRVGGTVCRLIEVCPGGEQAVAGAPRLRIVPVRAPRAGQSFKLSFADPCHSLAQPFMQSGDPETPWVVRARTADAAYQQLRDLPARSDQPRPVISVVEDSASAEVLPTNYAESKDRPELAAVVRWWQLPRPQAVRSYSGSAFNHGERLYPGSEDAIADAARALPSSKAIALLVDPREPGLPAGATVLPEFPALTAVQLQRRRRADVELLDVVGVFRKQDLELWWPVNMAELRYLQKHALATLRDEDVLSQPVEAGRLITIATLGVHENVLPQMAGTALDRSVDLEPEWIYHLVGLAASRGLDCEAEWERALGDIGRREGNGLLIPDVGIQRLRAVLAVHLDDAGPGAGADLETLSAPVAALAEVASEAQDALEFRLRPQDRTLVRWQQELAKAVAGVHDALNAILADSQELP
jgi:predicted MPP superfamily phosphohydrolase